MKEYKIDEFPTEYIPDKDFAVFVKSFKENAELASIGGKFRWVLTKDDGTRYIVRPFEHE